MTRKQPSARKLAAARANAAKSTGPRTPQGKARSSQNARRHGLCSQAVVLSTEDKSEFDRMYQSHIHRYQPADDVEYDLVETMILAKWRERRIVALGSEAMEAKMAYMTPEWDHLSDLGRTQEAFASVQRITPYDRYEAHAARQYERALKLLLLLRKAQPLAESVQNPEPEQALPALPNEANPENEHPGIAPAPPVIAPKPVTKPVQTVENTPPPLDDDLKAA